MSGFVSTEQVREMKRRAEEMVRFCDALLQQPELVLSTRSPEALSLFEPTPAPADGNGGGARGHARALTTGDIEMPAPGTFKPTSGVSYADLIYARYPADRFTMTNLLKWLHPLVRREPERFRQIVRQALSRDPRFEQVSRSPQAVFRKKREAE